MGIDAPSIDRVDATPEDLAAHHVLLNAGILHTENLDRPERIANLRDPLLVVLPLPLTDIDGAPVRAVAI